jgi:protein involved in ribonucleotide reduction
MIVKKLFIQDVQVVRNWTTMEDAKMMLVAIQFVQIIPTKQYGEKEQRELVSANVITRMLSTLSESLN